MREALSPKSIIFNPKLCSVLNSNRFVRRIIFPNPISSSCAKVLTAENHFPSPARIASFVSANQSRKKKTCTGSSLPFGKVAGFTKFCAVRLFPLFAKRNFPTSSTKGRNTLSISRISSVKMSKPYSYSNKKKRNTPS